MAEKGVIFGETAARQIAKTVREVSRRTVNEMPQRGRWHGRRGGSGGGHEIWFVINDMLCPENGYVEEETLVVTAEYYTGGCRGTPPGANDDGTFDVFNYCGQFVGLTREDLIGTKGKATYAYPLTGACVPRWFVDFLCAQPEC